MTVDLHDKPAKERKEKKSKKSKDERAAGDVLGGVYVRTCDVCGRLLRVRLSTDEVVEKKGKKEKKEKKKKAAAVEAEAETGPEQGENTMAVDPPGTFTVLFVF